MLKYPNVRLNFPYRLNIYSGYSGLSVNDYYVSNPINIHWIMLKNVVPVD